MNRAQRRAAAKAGHPGPPLPQGKVIDLGALVADIDVKNLEGGAVYRVERDTLVMPRCDLIGLSEQAVYRLLPQAFKLLSDGPFGVLGVRRTGPQIWYNVEIPTPTGRRRGWINAAALCGQALKRQM